MGSVQNVLDHMDWWGLITLLVSAVAALLCITFHELSHGLAAYRLGDPTAKNAGRLTLNPIKHIDPIGLLMMVVARVGWAKPVPVDMRYFKRPKRDMAITALAGPVSNFIMALAALALSSLIYHLTAMGTGWLVCLCLLSNLAVLSVGLGLFNLIPIPPLDGAKVLFSVLPDRGYLTILRYERYVMIALFFLVMSGAVQGPLSQMIVWVLRGLCYLVGYPINALFMTQDISYLARLFF